MLELVKLLLVCFSVALSYEQFFKRKNSELGWYWIVVAIYWFLNFAQGILK